MPKHRHSRLRPIEAAIILFVGCVIIFQIYSVITRSEDRHAKQSACTSNQKQIALAVQMYVTEHHEILPGTYGATDASWATMLEVGPQVFRCKDAVHHPGRDYGYNAALYGVAAASAPLYTKTILTADSDTGMALTNSTSIARRHEGGTIASFVDGHVAYAKNVSTMLNQSATEDNPWLLQGSANVITVDTKGACTFQPGATPRSTGDYVAVYFIGTQASATTICGNTVASAGAGTTVVVHADGAHALHRVGKAITAQ